MRQYMDENDRKWDETKEKRREAGKRGAQSRWAEEKHSTEETFVREDNLPPHTDDDEQMSRSEEAECGIGDCEAGAFGDLSEDTAKDDSAVDMMANDGNAMDGMANDGCAMQEMANMAVYDSDSVYDSVYDSVFVSDFESESESVSAPVPVSDFVPVSVSESGSAPAPARAPVPVPDFDGDGGEESVSETDNPYVQNVRDHIDEWKEKYKRLWEQRQAEQEDVQYGVQDFVQCSVQDLERTDACDEEHLEFFDAEAEQMNRRTLAECYCDAKQRDYNRTEEPTMSQFAPVGSTKPSQSPYAIPTPEAVEQYCRKHGLHTDPRRFHSINEKNGWMLNGKPIRDWQAVLRAWAKKDGI